MLCQCSDLFYFIGADVNLKNNGGRVALHYAASKGWTEIAETLISHGAKLNLQDEVCNSTLNTIVFYPGNYTYILIFIRKLCANDMFTCSCNFFIC